MLIDERFYSVRPPQTLSDLLDGMSASLPDSKFEDEIVRTPALLASSQPYSFCFLENKKHIASAETAKATACFVTEDLASYIGQRHIIPILSKTPKAHFSRATEKLVMLKTLANFPGEAEIDQDAQVHPTAIVGAGAVIGAGTVIGPFCSIGPGVEIGTNTKIDSNVHIECALIGDNCHIKSGAVIGGRGFGVSGDEKGLVDIVHIGRVLLGDSVTIGSGSCVDKGQLSDTVLEDGVKIDNLVQVGHNVRIGARTLIAAQVGISGSCDIGCDVIMGGNVGVTDHTKIGDGVSVAARAGVMHNIPAGETWSGIPAMPIRDHLKMVAAMRRLVKPKKVKDSS